MVLIKPIFQQHLKRDARFQDDKFGIWNGPPTIFMKHEHNVNETSKLGWDFSDLVESSVCMDLFIWIDRKSCSIKWRHYAKEMSLDLLLGPASAHAPGVHCGMILSRLETLHRHCSEIEDHKSKVHKFYQKMMNVRHSQEFLTTTFNKGGERLNSKFNKHQHKRTITNNKTPVKPHQRLFLHPAYHPKDTSRKTTQEICAKTC